MNSICLKRITLIISFSICINSLKAQLRINGDTIFVNAEAEVAVRFPSLPQSFSTIPSNAPYNFKTLGTGFTIIAKSENTKPAPLMVSEGGRDHRFIIAFKKDINYDNEAELDYDYSTTKKLEQHIKQMAIIKQALGITEDKPVVVDVPEEKKSKKKKEQPAQVENRLTITREIAAYYKLLETGDKAMKEQQYTVAKEQYEKAKTLRPDDVIPVQRLQEVAQKIADQEKAAKLEKDKEYINVTATAKASMDLKQYDKALDGYKKALQIRPGDLYATYQVEKIDKIIADQNSQQAKQQQRELYSGYIAKGDKALQQEKLGEARIAFEQALQVVPNDATAKNKLLVVEGKERKLIENTALEINYNSAIQEADKLFQAEDYEKATASYNKALSFLKKPWPQEQIKRIETIKTTLAAKQREDALKLSKQQELDKKQAAVQQQEDDYNSAIALADAYFKEGNYADAKTGYSKALAIIKRPWPQEQIKNIEKLQASLAAQKKTEQQQQAQQAMEAERLRKVQEGESRYTNAIKEADDKFKIKDYKNAKIAYTNALAIADRPWPKEQIKNINTIITQQAAFELAEKQRIAKEAAIDASYTKLMDAANAEFSRSNYVKARKLYNEASTIKPSETAPKERMQVIEMALEKIAADLKARNDSIAQAVETNRMFNLAILRGKSAVSKEDFAGAKIAYEEAAGLKPGDTDAQKQLNSINSKMEEIARAEAIEKRYDNKLSTADSLLIVRAYDQAIVTYKEALNIKPSERYPQSQIKYVQAEIKNQQQQLEQQRYLDSLRREEENDINYRTLVKQADKNVTERNFEEAKKNYAEALKVKPGSDYAIARLRIVNFQADKQKSGSATMGDETAGQNKKDKKAGKAEVAKSAVIPPYQSANLQINPLPYSKAELQQKYPDIDFSMLPPDQPFNDVAVNTKEKANIFIQFLKNGPSLNITDKNKNVELICHGIRLEEDFVYLKFLVRNNTANDFLTGSMMLNWIKKNGISIKLYPVYLFPAYLPIIKPGNESFVIYVCKSYSIADQDNLKFEMNDRKNTVKLQLSVSGKVYNDELYK
jgi:tetratricopeptide (TPR) repeat protein